MPPKRPHFWPPLQTRQAPRDDDQDGVPDAWERAHELDITNPHGHRDDPDNDGYTNIEEWLI